VEDVYGGEEKEDGYGPYRRRKKGKKDERAHIFGWRERKTEEKGRRVRSIFPFKNRFRKRGDEIGGEGEGKGGRKSPIPLILSVGEGDSIFDPPKVGKEAEGGKGEGNSPPSLPLNALVEGGKKRSASTSFGAGSLRKKKRKGDSIWLSARKREGKKGKAPSRFRKGEKKKRENLLSKKGVQFASCLTQAQGKGKKKKKKGKLTALSSGGEGGERPYLLDFDWGD